MLKRADESGVAWVWFMRRFATTLDAKVAKKFKVTTDNDLALPIAENLLALKFIAGKPNQ